MNPQVLLETKDVIVINKPAGLVVHADGKHDEPTVVDWVEQYDPQVKNIGEPLVIDHAGKTITVPRSGIVHRIDRDTSGCLVIARNESSFENLKEQFKEHTIKKKYIAIVFGWPRDERGIIDQPIGRSSSNIRAWTTKAGARGMRNAVTRFTVKKKFEYEGQKYAVVDLYPETGRTHQLRVHMSHMGHPLVADPIYAVGKSHTLPINRTALHAEKITFTDTKHQQVEVVAPIPADMAASIEGILAK
jgi:23S rRNA pseudouridine1911/1915/1917 synthase